MSKKENELQFLFTLNQAQSVISRYMDRGLGGVSLNEYIILHKLKYAENHTLSRTQLADILGLTASGITRLLLPMEKVGLVERNPSKEDARVNNVSLASGGRKKLDLAEEKIAYFIEEKIQAKKLKNLKTLTVLLKEICSLCK